MLENEMVTPKADYGPPEEEDADIAYDAARAALSDEAYADLHITLVEITRLQSVTAEIERLTKSLRDSLLGKPQALTETCQINRIRRYPCWYPGKYVVSMIRDYDLLCANQDIHLCGRHKNMVLRDDAFQLNQGE